MRNKWKTEMKNCQQTTVHLNPINEINKKKYTNKHCESMNKNKYKIRKKEKIVSICDEY